MHVELIHGEAILIRSFINIANDESFMSVIRGGLKMRQSYHTYKSLLGLSEAVASNAAHPVHHPDMSSAICLGVGGFDMILSLLPARVLKLVEFLGFTSSRTAGLASLTRGGDTTGLRAKLNDLILLGFHLVRAREMERDREEKAQNGSTKPTPRTRSSRASSSCRSRPRTWRPPSACSTATWSATRPAPSCSTSRQSTCSARATPRNASKSSGTIGVVRNDF